VIADHVVWLEAQPRLDVGDTAAGDDCDRKVARELGEALRHRLWNARLVGSRHDRREGAVKIEGEQRSKAHDGLQRPLAFRREQVLHMLLCRSMFNLYPPLP